MCGGSGRGGEGRGGWPHTSGTVILAPNVGLFFSTLYFQISRTRTKAHARPQTDRLVRLDRVELGWVGVLWLNAFPVMLHRKASGLLSYYWLSLCLCTCVCAFFCRVLHCCMGHQGKCCGEGLEPHSGDKVWVCLVLLSPDGRVQASGCSRSQCNGRV